MCHNNTYVCVILLLSILVVYTKLRPKHFNIATLGLEESPYGMTSSGFIIKLIHPATKTPTHPVNRIFRYIVSKERLIVDLEFQRKGQDMISSVALLCPACLCV